MTKTKLGIYIHIPFCERKCYYCDFNSQIINDEIEELYFDSLVKEINLNNQLYSDYIVDSIFIGGGTPSIAKANNIARIMKKITSQFDLSENCEITLEANPKSLDLSKLSIYKSVGINRISLGAQSFVDGELKKLGRIHNSKEILESIEMIETSGIKNLSIDLMMGIPDQTHECFIYSLMEAVRLGVNHISCYSLIIEESTPFFKLYNENKLNLVEDIEERRMYHCLCELMKQNGYIHYEISNFAKESYESIHNLKYWKFEDYLGLGLGSHYKIKNKRYVNEYIIEDYVNKIDKNQLPISSTEVLSNIDQINEIIFMGLRISEGFNYRHIEDKYKINFLEEYKIEIENNLNRGLIGINDSYIYLTQKGLDFANSVELDFFRIEGEI